MTEKNIYQKLLEAVEKLPETAVERASKEVTRKGYDTTGYQYQYLVNVLNDVVGVFEWGMDYKVIKEIQGQYKNGGDSWEITTDVTVWIEADGKKATRTLAGGHKSATHADALKGAITNGFKKTVALFGVGKKAYEGTIDEDYRQADEPVKPTEPQEELSAFEKAKSMIAKSRKESNLRTIEKKVSESKEFTNDEKDKLFKLIDEKLLSVAK